jgi:hypothetical protein
VRNQYRITKYDPSRRNAAGAYTVDEWTSVSDIGRKVSRQAYEQTERLYLKAIEAFLSEAGVKALTVRGLENRKRSRVGRLREGQRITLKQALKVARLILRERIWAKLHAPRRAFVHFGWDFYMYIGSSRPCPAAIDETEKAGLFVEPYHSPYK